MTKNNKIITNQWVIDLLLESHLLSDSKPSRLCNLPLRKVINSDGIKFESIAAAAEAYKVAPTTLYGHLRGNAKTCARLKWFYL